MAKDKSFKKPKKSNLVLGIKKEKKPNSDNLQRTEKWRLDRLGRWTGSQQKNLMSCSRSGGRITWNEIDKVFMFGETALKYIYENAMERKTGRWIDMGKGTKEMQYGTKVEPLILKSAKKEFKRLGIFGKLKKVGFKQFPTIPSAGVSSDAILVDKRTDQVLASVEIKACTNWSSHYDRTFEAFDEKSIDFWQTQGQMVAWSVNKTYYVVAEPPTDIQKYLQYDGDIMDLYKDFSKECLVSVQEVVGSEIHQKALLKRIMIAENTLLNFSKDYKDLRRRLHESIEFYKENKDKLKQI